MNKKTFAFELIIILFAIVLAVCAYFYFSRSPASENITETDPDVPTKVVIPGDDEKIFNSINGEKSESVAVFPNVSHDDVKALLEKSSTPDSFAWTFKSSLHSSKKVLDETGILIYNGENYKIELFDSKGQLTKTVVEDSGVVSISINNSVSEFTPSNSAFEEAAVPAVSDFLDSKGQDFSYSLIESEYGTLLYAEFTSSKGDFSMKEQYYISLDYGIVVRADCFENDVIVYSLETTSLHELEHVN